MQKVYRIIFYDVKQRSSTFLSSGPLIIIKKMSRTLYTVVSNYVLGNETPSIKKATKFS